jgi:hypothetical protein
LASRRTLFLSDAQNTRVAAREMYVNRP